MEHKERINYIVSTSTDKTVYVGKSVNYSIVMQGNTIEELEEKMKAGVQVWINHAQRTIDQENPFELKECTEEEWEAAEDNIDYWEIERVKRLLKRPTIALKFATVIAETIVKYSQKEYAEDTAVRIIDALIDQENK